MLTQRPYAALGNLYRVAWRNAGIDGDCWNWSSPHLDWERLRLCGGVPRMCDARKWWRNMAERPETQEKRKVILRAATEVFGEKGATKARWKTSPRSGHDPRRRAASLWLQRQSVAADVIYRDSVDLEDYPEDMARGACPRMAPSRSAISSRRRRRTRRARAWSRRSLRSVRTPFAKTARRTTTSSRGTAICGACLRRRCASWPTNSANRLTTHDLQHGDVDSRSDGWLADSMDARPGCDWIAEETERAIKLMLAGALDLNDEERDAIL